MIPLTRTCIEARARTDIEGHSFSQPRSRLRSARVALLGVPLAFQAYTHAGPQDEGLQGPFKGDVTLEGFEEVVRLHLRMFLQVRAALRAAYRRCASRASEHTQSASE